MEGTSIILFNQTLISDYFNLSNLLLVKNIQQLAIIKDS